MKAFWKALAVFAGTIIGVGIFGLPWVALKSGFFVLVIHFILLGVLAIFVHLILGDIILATPGKHRFPGYVRVYLGSFWSQLALACVSLGLFGAQLAYLVAGGDFLSNLLGPFLGGSTLLYTLIFFSLGATLIYKGIKGVSWTELLIALFFFILLGFLLVSAGPQIQFNRLRFYHLKFFLYPYGIVLFSIWGSSILPEIKEMLKGKRKQFRKVIVSGIILSIIVYLLFVIAILGSCGQNTTEDAITGLGNVLNQGIVRAGLIFGIITCFSSFLAIGLTLKKIFWYDVHLPEKTSWAITTFLPLVLFLAGLRGLVAIISLSGAIAMGIQGFIIIYLYKVFIKKKFSRKMSPAYFILSIFFALGALAEILYFVSK